MLSWRQSVYTPLEIRSLLFISAIAGDDFAKYHAMEIAARIGTLDDVIIHAIRRHILFKQCAALEMQLALGDNRRVANDSRYTEVGMVDTRHILGEAVFTLYPFDRFGAIE